VHFIDSIVERFSAHVVEVPVKQGAVQPFDEAVRLRPFGPRSPVLDFLELDKQLVRMPVEASAERAAVAGERDVDGGAVRLEGPEHLVVHHFLRGDRQLVRGQAGSAYRLWQSTTVCRSTFPTPFR